MKNKLNLLYIVLALGLLVGCESEPIMFDASKSHVAFTSGTASVAEEAASPAPIPVIVTALLNSPSVTVDFEVDADQSVAVEGEDFNIVNASKTLTFSDGWGYDTIWVQPVDNDEFGGNISFVIKLTANSQSYQFGALDSTIITIVDNEHPLKNWIGTYTVDAKSYGQPGNWDEVWSVTTKPVEGDVTKLSITGIGENGPTPIIATLDVEEMTISIAPGQNSDAYASRGYTEGYVYYGNTDLTFDTSRNLEGTISEDGTIAIDNFGIEVQYQPDPSFNGVWDVFNTTWTKTAKPLSDKPIVPNKLNRNDN